MNDTFVKVSRVEAQRARLERNVTFVSPQASCYANRWQKGVPAERMVLEDIFEGAENKKLILFVDLFCGVGDRMAAFYSIIKDKWAEVHPLMFFRHWNSAIITWLLRGLEYLRWQSQILTLRN